MRLRNRLSLSGSSNLREQSSFDTSKHLLMDLSKSKKWQAYLHVGSLVFREYKR